MAILVFSLTFYELRYIKSLLQKRENPNWIDFTEFLFLSLRGLEDLVAKYSSKIIHEPLSVPTYRFLGKEEKEIL